MNSAIRLREWSTFTYYPVDALLPELRALQLSVAASATPDRIKNLRTHKLARWREGWNACVFLKGIATVLGYPDMSFALVEQQDFDVIGRTHRDGAVIYTPIQLKEYRARTNGPTLAEELSKLQKYTDSEDLVVAVWLSGTQCFEYSDLRLPALKISSLWFFGCTSRDQTEWVLIGDMLNRPEISKYKIA